MKLLAVRIAAAALVALAVWVGGGPSEVRREAIAAPASDCLALATQLKQSVQATGRVDLAAFEQVKACMAANASSSPATSPSTPLQPATTTGTPPSIAAVSVARYMFVFAALGLPFICADFMSDGTVVGTSSEGGNPGQVTGTYFGSPYLLSFFSMGDNLFTGFTFLGFGAGTFDVDQPLLRFVVGFAWPGACP